MLSFARLESLLVAGVAVVATGVACSSAKPSTPGALTGAGGSGASAGTAGSAGASGGTGGSSATGGTGGSAGGSGGTGGSAGGGASGGAAGMGTGGSAGFSTTEAGAGAGGTAGSDGGITPIDQACTGGYAFRADGAAFTFPTPKNLGVALGSLTYDYNSHPITVVVKSKPDGSSTLVGASVTEMKSGGFQQVFPAGMTPTLAVGSVSAGGFSNTVDQDKGWIAVVDQTGTKYIEIDGIHITASTSGNCTGIIATLTGTIPASAGSVTLDLPSGSTTVSALAGGSGGIDGGVSGWNVHMLFTGESTDFAFSNP